MHSFNFERSFEVMFVLFLIKENKTSINYKLAEGVDLLKFNLLKGKVSNVLRVR